MDDLKEGFGLALTILAKMFIFIISMVICYFMLALFIGGLTSLVYFDINILKQYLFFWLPYESLTSAQKAFRWIAWIVSFVMIMAAFLEEW